MSVPMSLLTKTQDFIAPFLPMVDAKILWRWLKDLNVEFLDFGADLITIKYSHYVDDTVEIPRPLVGRDPANDPGEDVLTVSIPTKASISVAFKETHKILAKKLAFDLCYTFPKYTPKRNEIWQALFSALQTNRKAGFHLSSLIAWQMKVVLEESFRENMTLEAPNVGKFLKPVLSVSEIQASQPKSHTTFKYSGSEVVFQGECWAEIEVDGISW